MTPTRPLLLGRGVRQGVPPGVPQNCGQRRQGPPRDAVLFGIGGLVGRVRHRPRLRTPHLFHLRARKPPTD
jgi:hypothetical protein